MREFEKANALLAHNSLDLAACYSLTGDALRKHGFLMEAVEEYRKIETMAAVAADEPRFVFTVGIGIGLTLSEQGDSKSALSEYQKVVGLLQRQQNEGENQDFIALYHLCTGFELSKMGDAEGAVNHFQKAIDIYKCNSSKIDILFGFTLELAAFFCRGSISGGSRDVRLSIGIFPAAKDH